MIEIIQNFGIRPKFSYINVPGFADVGSVQHEHDYVPQTLKWFVILPSPQVLRVVCGHHTWVLRPLFWVTEWDWVRFSAMSCRIRYRLPSFQVVVFLILGPRSIRKICDNEITDLESHWKQKATSVFLMNAKSNQKHRTGSDTLSLITYNGVYCRTARHRWLSVQSWVLGCPWYGCSLVPWGTSNVQKLSTVPWCQLCWEGFVSIVGIAKKRSMSRFLVEKLGLKFQTPKEDSDSIVIWV